MTRYNLLARSTWPGQAKVLPWKVQDTVLAWSKTRLGLVKALYWLIQETALLGQGTVLASLVKALCWLGQGTPLA
jgi:hypothetical protein